MIIDKPARANGLYFVFNSRTKYDRDVADEKGGTPVFADWAFAKRALGAQVWSRVTRIALLDYGEAVEKGSDRMATERRELRKFLKAEKPALVVCVPPRSSRSRDKEKQVEQNKGVAGHQAWVVAKAPDQLDKMCGTVFPAPWGPTMGILNPINADFSVAGLVRRQLLGALAFSQGRLKLLAPKPGDTAWMPGAHAAELLVKIRAIGEAGGPVAVDIENVPSSGTITAIGLAAGPYAVCVPWDAFKIAGGADMEPAGPAELTDAVRAILALPCPKVTHNGRGHDVIRLSQKGIIMNGFVHDTIAACSAITNQWPKGLQRAVAAEFLIYPWKSYHHSAEHDIDSDEAWTANPAHLREYCSLDAWYDLRLFEAQMFKMGAYGAY